MTAVPAPAPGVTGGDGSVPPGSPGAASTRTWVDPQGWAGMVSLYRYGSVIRGIPPRSTAYPR